MKCTMCGESDATVTIDDPNNPGAKDRDIWDVCEDCKDRVENLQMVSVGTSLKRMAVLSNNPDLLQKAKKLEKDSLENAGIPGEMIDKITNTTDKFVKKSVIAEKQYHEEQERQHKKTMEECKEDLVRIIERHNKFSVRFKHVIECFLSAVVHGLVLLTFSIFGWDLKYWMISVIVLGIAMMFFRLGEVGTKKRLSSLDQFMDKNKFEKYLREIKAK